MQQSLPAAQHTLRTSQPSCAIHPRPTVMAAAVRSALLAGLVLGAMALALPQYARAQNATHQTSEQKRAYAVPAGSLDQALNRFASTAGIELSVDAALTSGKNSTGLNGSYTVLEGLMELLRGQGLQAVQGTNGSYSLRPASNAPDQKSPASDAVLPAVTVTMLRPDATTEGTGSYTSSAITIGKGEHSLRETPNSVSVVTRQRIDDQNMLTIEDAMQYTTGMKVTSYGTNSAAIESRGYTIDHYQIDGVSSLARVYENNFGLAMYDRVEVWRGPAGLLQGAGDPGGTVNFVRKRAQDTFGFQAKTMVGSWNNNYAEADVTGPLSDDGKLRGRLVAAYQDRDYFTDHAYSRLPMIYGTLEYDLDANTTLSVGTSWQRKTMRPFFGISAYADGSYPDISRSTYLGTDWGYDTQRASRTFAELEHRLDNGGKAKLSTSYTDRQNDAAYEWGNSFIDAAGNVDMVPYFSTGSEKEIDVDASITLPVQWRGLTQEFVAGASYQKLKSTTAWNGSTWGLNGFSQNIFHPDIHVPKPDIAIDEPTHAEQIQSALYGQARIKPWQPLTLLAGARMSWFENKDIEAPQNDQSIDAKLVPYAGVVLDVSQDFSLYGSYSSIFNPQSAQNAAGQYLAPRKGKQVELGIKGSHLDGRVNSSLAFYRIEDTNRAIEDPVVPNASIAAGKVRSQGLEAEIGGRLAPNWNLTAGYGYNLTKQIESDPANEGLPFTTTFPKHTLSLWTDYTFTDGWAQGFKIGGGARFRSSIYNTDSGVRFGQGAFTVYSVQGGYQISRNLKASLTVNNLFDKHYLDRPESGWRQTYFGEPRSVMLALDYKM